MQIGIAMGGHPGFSGPYPPTWFDTVRLTPSGPIGFTTGHNEGLAAMRLHHSDGRLANPREDVLGLCIDLSTQELELPSAGGSAQVIVEKNI